jgi:hypothetical protein
LTECPISETLPTVKPAIFHPAARAAIRAFPTAVKRQLGQAILDLQKGHHVGMPLSRPMPEVAVGVEELRLRDAAGIYRTFYFQEIEAGDSDPTCLREEDAEDPAARDRARQEAPQGDVG